MKFKQNQEDVQEAEKSLMSKELYNGFIDLIQFECNKLALISEAKNYFWNQGLMNYKKFFKGLFKACEEVKCCLIGQLQKRLQEIPEFKIPALDNDFDDPITPFKKLAEMEDEFETKLNDLINQAFEDKDWVNFHYLLKKLDTIDHICCRALAAVENKADVLALCEQHTSEK